MAAWSAHSPHRLLLLAFMFFSNAKRNEIKEANPDASFGEMVRIWAFANRYSISTINNATGLQPLYRVSLLEQHGKSLVTTKRPSGNKRPRRIRYAIRRKWANTRHHQMKIQVMIPMKKRSQKPNGRKKIRTLQNNQWYVFPLISKQSHFGASSTNTFLIAPRMHTCCMLITPEH